MLNSVKRYSSNVTILLLISGLKLEVAQLTDQHIYLRDPIEVEPGEGELVITVDDEAEYKPVVVPHGFRVGAKQALYF